jgi:hypothetical protein
MCYKRAAFAAGGAVGSITTADVDGTASIFTPSFAKKSGAVLRLIFLRR